MREVWIGRQTVAKRNYDYYILVREMKKESGVYGENYGLAISSGDERAEVRDITVSADRIRHLATLLMVQTVTPLTLCEIVEDWL
jgi:hypothetical protein